MTHLPLRTLRGRVHKKGRFLLWVNIQCFSLAFAALLPLPFSPPLLTMLYPQ